MPVTLRVGVNEARIARIMTNLRRGASVSCLEKVNLSEEAEEAREYLISKLPGSTGGIDSRFQAQFGFPISYGWQAHTFQTGSGVGFFVDNAEREGNDRLDTVLNSLDTGSRDAPYTARSTYAFPDLRGLNMKRSVFNYKGMPFTTIAEGREVQRPARAGANFTRKTFQFILERLLPGIRQKVLRTIKEDSE